MNGLDLLVFGLVGPIDKAEAYQYDYNEEIIIKTFLEKIINQKKMEKKPAKYYEDLMHVANEFRTATNNKIIYNYNSDQYFKKT
ncbi:hypothetical protein BpHYR1_014354 [Brachionus plicatilis]|uniref:Uncharacterized protein n=1 Tax=Brachionus plicatilis TaxID=10195 RepID=A0A3M7P412_BRAPC|nr:hypothetical protein BpHYR1_014354 [Brachionus plicatilis]